MNLDNITPKQLEKMAACKTVEDILALAKEEGYELTNEEIQSISGGSWSPKDGLPQCPVCGSYAIMNNPMPGTGCMVCTCRDCGHQWTKTMLDPVLPN